MLTLGPPAACGQGKAVKVNSSGATNLLQEPASHQRGNKQNASAITLEARDIQTLESK